MARQPSYTLSEVAVRLDVPQHRLIHLCEKGVVAPDLQDASGRGSSRRFSPRNLLEFAVALRLREMMLPVAVVGPIVHVLHAFDGRLKRERNGLSLPDSLRDKAAPDLRIILSDGRLIYFSLGQTGRDKKLFGGIPLEQMTSSESAWDMGIKAARTQRDDSGTGGFGAAEGSRFTRLELSVTEVARDLQLD
jgi:DNA-binding transcriptional MerR regulator